MLLVEVVHDAAIERLKNNTVWFAERSGQAFPGVRGVAWFENPWAARGQLRRARRAAPRANAAGWSNRCLGRASRIDDRLGLESLGRAVYHIQRPDQCWRQPGALP